MNALDDDGASKVDIDTAAVIFVHNGYEIKIINRGQYSLSYNIYNWPIFFPWETPSVRLYRVLWFMHLSQTYIRFTVYLNM